MTSKKKRNKEQTPKDETREERFMRIRLEQNRTKCREYLESLNPRDRELLPPA